MAGGTPPLPWKTKLLLAGYTLVVDWSCRSDGTVNRRLINFLEPKSRPSPKPINGVSSSDITVDPSRNLWFRLYTVAPAVDDTKKLPVIIFFHGGGFAFFSAATKPYDDFCRRLAADLRAVVVSVDYRLAPEHRFPTQFDDGFEALKFLDSDAGGGAHLPEFADLGRCFIAGDSSGGNIAHHITLRAAANHREFNKLKIAGLIAIQAFFGGEERTESELRLTNVPSVRLERSDWMWRAVLPPGSDRNHEAAHVFAGDISGAENYPATMVVVGGFDPLQDWQKRFYEWLKKAGKETYLVEYPNSIHAFYAFPELPEGSLLITEMGEFIQKQSLSSK